MNVLLTQYLKFQSWKEKSCEGGGAAEERGVEGKVSYSVSGDLQITLKYHMISWKLDFK